MGRKSMDVKEFLCELRKIDDIEIEFRKSQVTEFKSDRVEKIDEIMNQLNDDNMNPVNFVKGTDLEHYWHSKIDYCLKVLTTTGWTFFVDGFDDKWNFIILSSKSLSDSFENMVKEKRIEFLNLAKENPYIEFVYVDEGNKETKLSAEKFFDNIFEFDKGINVIPKFYLPIDKINELINNTNIDYTEAMFMDRNAKCVYFKCKLVTEWTRKK